MSATVSSSALTTLISARPADISPSAYHYYHFQNKQQLCGAYEQTLLCSCGKVYCSLRSYSPAYSHPLHTEAASDSSPGCYEVRIPAYNKLRGLEVYVLNIYIHTVDSILVQGSRDMYACMYVCTYALIKVPARCKGVAPQTHAFGSAFLSRSSRTMSVWSFCAA